MSKTIRSLLWLPVIGALGAGVAACGGSSKPTVASYDKSASSICRSYNSKMKPLGRELSSASTKAQAEKTLDKAISVAKQGTDKLNSLKLPKSPSVHLLAARRDQSKAITDLQALSQAIKSGSSAKAKAAADRFDRDNSAINNAWNAAGVKACGGSGSS